MAEHEEFNLYDIIPASRAYFTVDKPKQGISNIFFQAKQEGRSLRQISEEIGILYHGSDRPIPAPNTIRRITRGDENYGIDALLMALDALGKKIVIVDRTEEDDTLIESRGKTK